MKSNVLNKLFGFDSNQHKLQTEIIAGLTTFLTMAYILAVNPSIFGALDTMPKGASFTATALAAIVGTLVMAFYAKKPFALAPGMGLNAFFVYSVCLGMGYSWQFALTAILIEGVIFVILSVTNIRAMIVDAIPSSIKLAIGGGIGLFLALAGLQNAGVVVDDPATMLTLGNVKSANMVIFLVGFLATAILAILHIRGSLLLGMLVATIVGIPLGVTQLNGVVSAPETIAPIFCKFEWNQIFSWDMFIVVFTFLFLDLFDTIGTVVGVSVRSGMIDENGKIDGIKRIFMSDAIATIAGACFGTCTTTTYAESATGVAAGGRSGLTAFVVAVGFAIALFFSPIFLAIPSAATGAVLVIVGVMMMTPIKDINWLDFSESIPAFIAVVMMPFSFSIAHGILLSMIAYVVINAIVGIFKHEYIHKISTTMWILAVLFILRYIFL